MFASRRSCSDKNESKFVLKSVQMNILKMQWHVWESKTWRSSFNNSLSLNLRLSLVLLPTRSVPTNTQSIAGACVVQEWADMGKWGCVISTIAALVPQTLFSLTVSQMQFLGSSSLIWTVGRFILSVNPRSVSLLKGSKRHSLNVRVDFPSRLTR